MKSTSGHNWEQIFPPPDDPDEKPSPIGTAPPGPGFGGWTKAEARTVYKAETDGFVSAYTNGGNDGLRINIGDKPTPSALATRGPARSYDGTVAPVSKGDYWVVIPNDQGGDVRCLVAAGRTTTCASKMNPRH